MSRNTDTDDKCAPDRDKWDDEPPCPDCRGKGWLFLLTTQERCAPCQGTGVDLVAAGYIDTVETED